MNTEQVIKGIDGIVTLASVLGNAAGAAAEVGVLIAERIASGATEWTDDQRATVESSLQAAKARAQTAADTP
jgi:hypothetical protein